MNRFLVFFFVSFLVHIAMGTLLLSRSGFFDGQSVGPKNGSHPNSEALGSDVSPAPVDLADPVDNRGWSDKDLPLNQNLPIDKSPPLEGGVDSPPAQKHPASSKQLHPPVEVKPPTPPTKGPSLKKPLPKKKPNKVQKPKAKPKGQAKPKVKAKPKGQQPAKPQPKPGPKSSLVAEAPQAESVKLANGDPNKGDSNTGGASPLIKAGAPLGVSAGVSSGVSATPIHRNILGQEGAGLGVPANPTLSHSEPVQEEWVDEAEQVAIPPKRHQEEWVDEAEQVAIPPKGHQEEWVDEEDIVASSSSPKRVLDPELVRPKLKALSLPVGSAVVSGSVPRAVPKVRESAESKQVSPSRVSPSRVSPGPLVAGAQNRPTLDIGKARIHSQLRQLEGNPLPVYPKEALKQKWEGRADIVYYVNSAGFVEKPQLYRSSGHSVLDKSAVRALARYRYYPGQEGWVRHPVEFLLELD